MTVELTAPIMLPLIVVFSNDLKDAAQSILAVFVAISLMVPIAYFFLGRTVFAQDSRKGTIRGIRILQISLAFFFILLVNGIIQMHGEPLLPNLIGIIVNLCWQAGTVAAIRNQKKLNEASQTHCNDSNVLIKG